MKKLEYKLLGNKIKQIRKEKGISRKELAEKIGVDDDKTVGRIETGRRRVKITELILLCYHLDVNPDNLIEGTFSETED